MYRTYKTPIAEAAPAIKIPEPRVSKFVIFLLRILGRFYLFLLYGIARIVFEGGDKALLETFKRNLDGKSRCMIAFRHPNGGEPQILTWFFLFKVKSLARKNKVRFSRPPHAFFVYGYEVFLWGGGPARFIMPRIGAMHIFHAKMDTRGMDRIYKTIQDGAYPLALAPEGQVSYTTDSVPRLEPGVIRIGFNAAERMAQNKPDCPIEILPLSVFFRYGAWGSMAMGKLLKKVEKLTGLYQRGRERIPFTERVRQCRDHILKVNEERYGLNHDNSLSFAERLDKVINAALETGERMIGAKSEGIIFARMYRLRQYCWDRIYLPEFENFKGISRIERSVRDLQAGEAWYIARHQEIVDFCWYFRLPPPAEEAALHNKVEYVQNLWDFANRTMGGAFSDRANIFPQKVIIRAAPVINLSERLPSYRQDKKAAIAEAMTDLEKAYLNSIEEANREEG